MSRENRQNIDRKTNKPSLKSTESSRNDQLLNRANEIRRDDDIVKILSLVDFKISKSELGAFFRSEDHPKYMDCQDQILRNFLNGLIIYKRGPRKDKR